MTPADKQEIISRCKTAEMPGLYVMVLLCLINSCTSNNVKPKDLNDRLDRIEGMIEANCQHEVPQ
jgi:hypothetical protein